MAIYIVDIFVDLIITVLQFQWRHIILCGALTDYMDKNNNNCSRKLFRFWKFNLGIPGYTYNVIIFVN